MKNLKPVVTVLAMAVVLTACLFSQTRVDPGQIKPQLSNGVLVNVVGKGLVLAVVDPATMALDTTVTPPILRALVSPPPVASEKHVVLHPATGATTLTIPDATYIPATLGVYVNGVLQALTDDYTVSGVTVTLIRPVVTGDIDQITYRF